MRRVFLMVSVLVLLAVLCVMWAYRFERVPGVATWNLEDLRDGTPITSGAGFTKTPDHVTLRLWVESAEKPVAIRLVIPGMPAVAGLHLRFRLASRGLKPGREPWQEGRIMVEWYDMEGGEMPSEIDPVGSSCDDKQSGWLDFVVQPDHAPAVPVLRVEHLGRAGEFELSDLQVTAVRERLLWRIGRWFLAGGWLAWAAAMVRLWPGVSLMRAIGAAAIWVVLGTQFVIPGPWKIQRPMAAAFQLGDNGVVVPSSPGRPVGRVSRSAPVAVESRSLEALGKLPDQGSLVLRVKLAVTRARPLLHALLLFAPTLLFLLLVGSRPALCLAVLLAVAIELSQIAFGYGFDWVDVGDLACDAAGVMLALWVFGRVIKKT